MEHKLVIAEKLYLAISGANVIGANKKKHEYMLAYA